MVTWTAFAILAMTMTITTTTTITKAKALDVRKDIVTNLLIFLIKIEYFASNMN